MKNSMKRTALLLAAILLLSACGVQPSVTTKEETTAESVQEETTAENTREETEKPSAAESTGQTEPASETVTESAAEETAAESPSEKVDEPTTDDPTPYEESSEETPEESESETAEEPPLTEEAAAYHAAVREGSYTLAGELSLTRTIGEESYVTKDSFHMNIRSEESESPSAAGELTHSIKGAGMEAEHGYQLFYGDGKGTLLREGAAFTAVQTLEDFLSCCRIRQPLRLCAMKTCSGKTKATAPWSFPARWMWRAAGSGPTAPELRWRREKPCWMKKGSFPISAIRRRMNWKETI